MGALKDAKKGLKDAKKGAEKFKTHTKVKIAKAKKEVAKQKAKAKNIERANKAAKKKLSFLCSAWAKQGLCKAKSSYKAFMFNECCDECGSVCTKSAHGKKAQVKKIKKAATPDAAVHAVEGMCDKWAKAGFCDKLAKHKMCVAACDTHKKGNKHHAKGKKSKLDGLSMPSPGSF